MKIFAGGIATETNTFSPVPTSLEDFQIQRGRDVLRGRIDYPALNLEELWGTSARAQGADFVFSLMAWATPSGTTLRSAYETLRDELLTDLEAALPVDIVLLHLHGAMVAQGYDDCEEDIIRRVRDVVGASAIIGVELDLHCHLSESMLEKADIVIVYKEYPHVDIADRARELFELALKAQRRAIRPTMALFDCRMIGLYPTTREPLRNLVDAMTEAERRPGVLSVSFGHGFQFGDVPHMGAKVLVVADDDAALAARVAREFGERVHALRDRIGFERLSLPLEPALIRAIESTRRPVIVADQSDNAGGGAPADSTYALRWLLDHGVRELGMAIHYDPEVVKLARKAGIGATLPVRVGGKMGPFSGDPVDLEVRVLGIRERYEHAFPQTSGDPWYFPAGDVVALRHEAVDLIVSSERCQCFSPEIFTDFGIDPRAKHLLVVKSVQHFYSAFAPIAGEVIYMAARGAVNPDPKQVPYTRFDPRHTYPWVENPLAR
jgi:microcystin degradation protein MlrC